MLNASTDAKTRNYGARTEGIWNFNKGKLYSGLDYRVEGAEGIRTREFLLGPNAGKTVMDNAWQDGQISKTGIFGEYQINANSINYIVSARVEYNQSSVQDPSPEFLEVYSETDVQQLNTNFSFGLQKRWNPSFKTGLHLGRGLRSGSLTERFINYFPVGQDPYELIGNPNLEPESNNQIDLNVEWQNNNTTFNIDLYASYINDYITSIIDPTLNPRIASSPGVRRFENIDEAFKTGFEFSWNQSLGNSLNHQLAIAYTYAQDLERDEPLPETPPLDLRYTLNGSYLNGKLSPGLTLRHTLSQNRISTEYGETETPSFSLIDIRLAYEISNNINIELGVNNLLDELYYEHLNRSVRGSTDPIYAQGRNLFTKLNIHF
jgi:iron complex outermembrane receptor protein